MPYCPRCGSEVDENKNFCQKCGEQLNSQAVRNTHINNFKKWYSKRHNNLEFVLALIALILAVLVISQFFTIIPLGGDNLITFLLIVMVVAVISTVLTRYHARTGSLMLLISLLVLFVMGFGNLSGAVLFAVIAVVVSFVLNRFK